MISGIHVSSSEVVINRGEGGEKNTIPLFVKDQIVHAKVLDLLPQGHARLLINNRMVTAKTGMLLKPGEEIQLKVLEEKEAVHLKFIGPVRNVTLPQISSLIRFFSGKESIMDITRINIPYMKDLLYDMALKSGKTDKAFLPALIEKIGMTWENKLSNLLQENHSLPDNKLNPSLLFTKDLKALIQKELYMSGPDHPVNSDIASLSETLENLQLLNHQSSESGKFLLPFPVLSENAFRFGQLFIDLGGKKKADDNSSDKLIQIAFLMDMSLLGSLRADFSILKKEISGRFILENEETRQYVQSMMPELKERLESIDYHVHEIECASADQTRIQPHDFIETLLKSGTDRVLNIVI
ncbi:MAG: hypothetical protein A2277_15475 [Desulfobacterales bacterium RIFOXYA12_FULL_46_15]|nr:MAG: hypothetical protein A2097_05850 [Desulfobacula sp. GWF2_41_7]OGR27043.1 MAG: hypothetical protein A2277_15475 [Desulfobacterales bacterium RIFOXYA12_FULL_46_15]